MTRQHIHFAIGEPHDKEVISGMRKTCDVYVYVNVEKMIQDKVPIFLSSNNVLLSPGVGNTGSIPPQYFERVVNIQKNQTLWPE
jgi:RNA:NAD 2'-phosphotransferase (TPT1/KptA family)